MFILVDVLASACYPVCAMSFCPPSSLLYCLFVSAYDRMILLRVWTFLAYCECRLTGDTLAKYGLAGSKPDLLCIDRHPLFWTRLRSTLRRDYTEYHIDNNMSHLVSFLDV